MRLFVDVIWVVCVILAVLWVYGLLNLIKDWRGRRDRRRLP